MLRLFSLSVFFAFTALASTKNVQVREFLPGDARDIQLEFVSASSIRADHPHYREIIRLSDGDSEFRDHYQQIPTIAVGLSYRSRSDRAQTMQDVGEGRYEYSDRKIAYLNFPRTAFSAAELKFIGPRLRLMDRQDRARAQKLFDLEIAPEIRRQIVNVQTDQGCYEAGPFGGEPVRIWNCEGRVKERVIESRMVTVRKR